MINEPSETPAVKNVLTTAEIFDNIAHNLTGIITSRAQGWQDEQNILPDTHQEDMRDSATPEVTGKRVTVNLDNQEAQAHIQIVTQKPVSEPTEDYMLSSHELTVRSSGSSETRIRVNKYPDSVVMFLYSPSINISLTSKDLVPDKLQNMFLSNPDVEKVLGLLNITMEELLKAPTVQGVRFSISST